MKSPTIDAMCSALGLPPPRSEYRFAAPRKWRFDWAWPHPYCIALEVQGGLFSGGRHVRGAALLKEHEKLNAAAIRGWRLLYCTPKQFESGEALVWVAEAVMHMERQG